MVRFRLKFRFVQTWPSRRAWLALWPTLACALLTLSASCGKEDKGEEEKDGGTAPQANGSAKGIVGKDAKGTPVRTPTPDLSVWEPADVNAIVKAKCANCHGQMRTQDYFDLYPQDTFNAVYAKRMPQNDKGFSESEDGRKFLTWLVNVKGAKPGTFKPITPVPTVDGKMLTYVDVKPLLVANCERCHAPAGTHQTYLDTFMAFKNRRDAIRGRVEAQTMPPAPGFDSEENRAKVLAWLREGKDLNSVASPSPSPTPSPSASPAPSKSPTPGAPMSLEK